MRKPTQKTMTEILKHRDISVPIIALVALLTTALVTSQVISSKLIAISLPLVGTAIMPAGVIAYAFTFFSTDLISELYGRKTAQKAVNVAFVMNFVLFTLLYLAVVSPAAQGSVDPNSFSVVLLSSANIIFGSLGAYIVSQNFDVSAFHRIREKTGGKHLWLRNIGSTGISQFIDTVIFIAIAFWVAPQIFGIGMALPLQVIISLIVGQYVAKLLIALFDTPLVYAGVRIIRNRE